MFGSVFTALGFRIPIIIVAIQYYVTPKGKEQYVSMFATFNKGFLLFIQLGVYKKRGKVYNRGAITLTH